MELAGTHRLGTRAFFFFLSRRLKWVLIFLIALIVLWTQKDRFPVEYHDWSDYGFSVLLYIWIGFFVFILIRSFFEYRGYSFEFDEEFFRVNRGYFLKHEMGIVYHQIQYVTVKRSLFDRSVGVGHLIIVTNVGGSSGLSEIVLPALDKTKARLVQRELLRKAHLNLVRKSPARPRKDVSSAEEEDIDEVEEEIEEEL